MYGFDLVNYYNFLNIFNQFQFSESIKFKANVVPANPILFP